MSLQLSDTISQMRHRNDNYPKDAYLKWNEYDVLHKLAIAPKLYNLYNQVFCSPLEALLSISSTPEPQYISEVFRYVNKCHPDLKIELLQQMIESNWHLQHKTLKLSEESTLLVYLYSIRSRKVLDRTKYFDKKQVALFFKYSCSDEIKNNSLGQQLISSTNPSVFKILMTQKDFQIDELSKLIMFIHGRYHFTKEDYLKMDESVFVQFLDPKFHSQIWYRIESHFKQFNFPQQKLELVYQHNPSLYILNVVLNEDAFNAESICKKWFQPMLLKMCQDETGVSQISFFLDKTRHTRIFEKAMYRYSPEEYHRFQQCKTLLDLYPELSKTFCESFRSIKTNHFSFDADL